MMRTCLILAWLALAQEIASVQFAFAQAPPASESQCPLTSTGDLDGDGAADTVRCFLRPMSLEFGPGRPIRPEEAAEYAAFQKEMRARKAKILREYESRKGTPINLSSLKEWAVEVTLSSFPDQPFEIMAFSASAERPPPGPIRVQRATPEMVQSGRAKGYRWNPDQGVVIIEQPGKFNTLKYWTGEHMPGFGVPKSAG